MKKALAIFVTVCLLASLFVSCDNTTKLDELVSTRFDAAESRSLTVSNEDFIGFNDPSIKWQYKAVKVSDTSYNVGAAAEWTLIPAKEYAIGDLRNSIEFSQGKWNFELRAVKTADTSVEVYYGETELPVLLTKKDGIRTISINLSTQHEGQKGYIVLDTIQVKHTSNGAVAYDAPSKVIIDDADAVKRRELVLGTDYVMSEARDSISSNTETGYQISVGTHTVKVQKIGVNDEILAEEEKTIEVYAGLKTTISNWIVEITQAGKFVVFTDTDSTDISVPSEGSSVDVVFSGITPSMVNGNDTTVTLPRSTLTGAESPKLSVAVKQASEASVDGAFNATDGEKVIAAVIDLSLSSSSGLIENFGDNTVIVSTYVAKNLAGFNFGYPGEDGWNPVTNETDVDAAKEYWYDSESGKLVFGTNHFSSFIVETSSAAVIGDTAYKTLADAINGASDGDTVVLLNNTSVSNTSNTVYEGTDIGYACIFIQDKGITIDGNGKVITLSANEPAGSTYGIYITGTDNSKTVTIKNTTINTTNLERAIRTYGSIGFKIVDSKITTNGVGVHVKGSNKADIINTQITVDVIDNNVYSAHKRAGVVVGGSDANVKVDGCTINAINTDKNNNTEDDGYQNTWCKGLYAGTSAKNGVLTVNNTKVVADFSIAIDGTGDSGNPSQITINSGEYSGIIGSPSGGSYKSLTINGGTFTGIENYKSFYGKDDSVAKLVISGGTFNVKPDSQFIVDGKCAVAQDDKWIVQSLAVIGTKGYATLEDAVRDAKDGDTIVMLRDSAGNGIGLYSGATGNQIPTKNITIDLNGFTYTIDGSLQGSTGTVSQAFHLEQGCAVTIKNGTIASTKANMLIQNYCNLTLDKMVLDFNKDYPLSNNQGNITIKDTTITSKGGDGIAFDVYSFGNYKGTTVTVEGNSIINGTVELDRTNSASLSLIIENGTFNKDISKKKNENCTVVIKGGTFSCDPTGYVDSNVYHVIENGNTWTVTAK